MISGIFLIAVGLFIMVMTMMKPPLYWESTRTLKLRKRFGDAIANIIYILLAIMLVFYGASLLS
jgi:hypothetical protein